MEVRDQGEGRKSVVSIAEGLGGYPVEFRTFPLFSYKIKIE